MSTASPINPLKILISAYACRPNVGSEPGVGWNITRTLAQYHELFVFTRSDNRPAIEAELQNHPSDNLKFIYLDPPKWVSWLPSAQLPHYYFWQVEAYAAGKRLLETQTIDLIHHITYVRYSTPSFLSRLQRPFIWGPVGGGEQAPKAFWQSFSLRGKAYEILRTVSHRIGELDPSTQKTAHQSILVRATTQDTAVRLKKLGAAHVQVASALGLSQSEIDQFAQQPEAPSSTIRFISIARLLHWKGIYLGLQAFAQAIHTSEAPENCEYWIIGEGPERERLEKMTRSLDVVEQVKFLGSLARDKTLQKLAECHVLLHPSLHDSGGFVCLEAMAAGRPVICLDLGGPAVQVTPEAGILVTADNPAQTVQALKQAMLTLAGNSELRAQMGQAGRIHVQQNYTWEAKGKQLAKLYNNYLNSGVAVAPTTKRPSK
ncbi:MAG: glycosyltransferase family 4 protein [Cyanobacteria bacterium J06634_5]